LLLLIFFFQRKFNGWVKSVLISLYLPAGASVLDLAGGKGGDFAKWKNGGISHLVLADVAHGSVEHALDRYQNSKDNLPQLFRALFISGDAFGLPLFTNLDAALRFQFVSCQFAFHYSFECEERLRMTLQNITERLEPGCHFVGTVPNAYRLVHLLRSVRGLSWKNSICGIEFDESTDKV
jgi:mRNA (guanine-N7-)-methyltransferase